jgi:hypothetical protein
MDVYLELLVERKEMKWGGSAGCSWSLPKAPKNYQDIVRYSISFLNLNSVGGLAIRI